jgi:drug/metabolite transporter (DMT)-like permease
MVVSAFAAIYFLYGGTYLAIALGLRSIPPFLLMGGRSILGGSVLLLLSRIHGSRIRAPEDWLHAAISGMLLFVGCHGALGGYLVVQTPNRICRAFSVSGNKFLQSGRNLRPGNIAGFD